LIFGQYLIHASAAARIIRNSVRAAFLFAAVLPTAGGRYNQNRCCEKSCDFNSETHQHNLREFQKKLFFKIFSSAVPK
jgi:hypothetical protein